MVVYAFRDISWQYVIMEDSTVKKPLFDSSARLKSVRSWLSSHKQIDALLLVRQEMIEDSDLRYMTGFTGSSGYAVVTAEKALFFTDSRYVEQASLQCLGWHTKPHGRPAVKVLAAELESEKIDRMAFDPNGLTVSLWEELRVGLTKTILEPVKGIIADLRLQKEPTEIASIAEACSVSDAAFLDLLKILRPGLRERDVAHQLENLLYDHGAEALAFDSIVASGPNSAFPHIQPSGRQLSVGDIITFDFGARVNGYCADITRTVIMGSAVPAQRRLYDAVHQFQVASVKLLKPGVRCNDVARSCQRAIEAAGYGRYPTHSLGHGVGLAIHEGPALRSGSEDILQVGHVVTIEPGIYIPGFGGVRIEDTVVIEKDGCQVLTSTPRDLLEIRATN